MTSWTELQVGIIYYGAILFSLGFGVFTVVYLRPSSLANMNGVEGTGRLLSRSLGSTLIMAAVLGALSVSLKNCEGDFVTFVGRPLETINRGRDQLSSALKLLLFTSSFWFVLLCTLRLAFTWRLRPFLFMALLMLAGLLAVIWLAYFLLTFE